uniref:VCBS repeat domain-containing M23 family metallopeptidase n=1 Tax=Micromonospora okii TaxID=1182970 RepID=UPI001E5A56A9|nr:VCBS repeat domain-containing M23 family metallopeptidase [Micromonospora okii]
MALGAAGLATVASAPAAAAGPRPAFQLPFPCGESWRLSTYAGHDDYDVDMIATSGTTAGRSILASYAGTVTYAGWDNGGGWYVKLNHGGGWESLYLHMQSAPVVSTGQSVKRGQLLGRVGSTGNSSGPHLHHEQRRDGAKVETWFNGVPSGITTDGYPSGEPQSPPVTVVSANCGDADDQRRGSVTGDAYADLLVTKADGTLWLYGNNFVRDDGMPYNGGSRQVGHGWGAFTHVVPADVTGDGFTDLLVTKADGTLWLYGNNIVRDDGMPYNGGSRQVGHGWGAYTRILAADVTGDGFTDLLALDAAGKLWLYANNFVRDDGMPYNGGRREVGHGWGAFESILPADVTGDGFTDLLVTKADGTLWLYGNNFVRDDGMPYNGGSRQVGHGWGAFTHVVPADVTGDGFTDLLVTKADGTLWLYGNNIVRDDGMPYNGGSRQVGHGWGAFESILA